MFEYLTHNVDYEHIYFKSQENFPKELNIFPYRNAIMPGIGDFTSISHSVVRELSFDTNMGSIADILRELLDVNV